MSKGGRAAWRSALVGTLLIVSASCKRETVPEVQAAGIVSAAAPLKLAADDWPQWGGPEGNHIARSELTVTSWGIDKNIQWSSPVPGTGHSTPIVIGPLVVVTTAEEQAGQQRMLAFDRLTGAERWSTVLHKGRFPRKHSKNSHASATPVSDGTHIFVPCAIDDGLYVTAVDLAGHIAWQTRLGPFGSEHGFGSSPVLYENLVLVNGDNLQDSYVAAVHRGSGELVWRTKRTTTGQHGSYGTPILATSGGKARLVLSGMKETSVYDPTTGQLQWKCAGPSEVTANTPAYGHGLIFSSGGYPEKEILAIRLPAGEQVGAPQPVWRSSKGTAYVPTPLYRDGRLYVVSDGGVVTCFEADSGHERWQGRLAGSFSASPMCAGDVILVPNEEGTTYVLGMGDAFEVLGENQLGDGGFASPVVTQGQLFLRTNHHLYCIGKPRDES